MKPSPHLGRILVRWFGLAASSGSSVEISIRDRLAWLLSIGAVILFSLNGQAQDLFVADHARVDEFTPGGVRSTFASGFGTVFGVAFDNAGNLFVADNNNEVIVKISPAGVKSTFGSASDPWGMVCDTAGNLFVADGNGGTIQKFTPSGVQSTFASGLSFPIGIAIDSAGNVFVADDANVADRPIYKFTASGVRSTFGTVDNIAGGLAFDSAGNLFAVSANGGNDRIYKFTPAGVRSLFFDYGDSEPKCPAALAFDSTGNLFVAEQCGTNDIPVAVGEITPAGVRTTFVSGVFAGFGSPYFLSFTPFPVIINGNLSASATVGKPFVYQIAATHHPTSYSAAGLPAGLSIDTGAGIISGIPTASGNVSITISVSNSYGTSSGNLALTVQPAPGSGPQIISSSTATGRTGQPFSFQILTSGATSAAQLTIGPLPAGLNADPVNGLISGTPTDNGNFSVALSITDGLATTSETLQLTFFSDPEVPIITSPDAVPLIPNQFFSYTVTADAAGDFSYIGTDGIRYQGPGPSTAGLPSGLSFDGVGTISGMYNGVAIPPTPDTIKIRPPVVAIIQTDANNVNGTGTGPLNFFQPAAGSRKNYGSAGTFDINLPLTGTPGIESRSGGANGDYQVVFAFPTAVTFSGASVTPGPGSTASVTNTSTSADGKEVSVNLTNVSNGQQLTVALSGVHDGVNANNVDVAVQMSVLVGDANGNGTVNASDIGLVKSQSGHPITASNYRADVTGNGVINSADISLVKSRSGTSLHTAALRTQRDELRGLGTKR